MMLREDAPVGQGAPSFAVLDDVLLTGSPLGIFALRDDGEGWRSVRSGPAGPVAASDGQMIVATPKGATSSSARGMLWRNMSDIPAGSVARIAGAASVIWVGVRVADGEPPQVYRWREFEGWSLAMEGLLPFGCGVGSLDGLLGHDGVVYVNACGAIWRRGAADKTWLKTVEGLGGDSAGTFAVHAGRLHVVAGGVPHWLDTATWTWAPISSHATAVPGLSRALCLLDASIYVGSAAGGVIGSTDGGASWTDAGLPGVVVSALHAHRGAVYAADVGGAVHRLDTGASEWRAFGAGMGAPSHRMHHITALGDRLYATTGEELHVSEDDGATWAPVAAPSDHASALAADGQALYVGSLGDGLHVLDGATGTWRQAMPLDPDIDAEWVAPLDGVIYAGDTHGGVYADAEALAPAPGEAMRLRAAARVLLRYDKWVYVAQPDGLLLSQWGGRGGGLSPTPAWIITGAATLDTTTYISTTTAGVQRHRSNRWQAASDGLPTSHIRDLARMGPALYAAASNLGVYRGVKDAPVELEGEANPLSLVASDATVYVGVVGGDIYGSDDDGRSWSIRAATPAGRAPRDLAILDDTLYVATEAGVFRLAHDGTWDAAPLTPPIIRSIAAGDGVVFVLTDTAIYRAPSPNGSWTRVSDNPSRLARIALVGGWLYGAPLAGALQRAAVGR